MSNLSPSKFDPKNSIRLSFPFALHPHISFWIAIHPHISFWKTLHPHISFWKTLHPHISFFCSSPSHFFLVCRNANTWVKFRSSHSQFSLVCKNLKICVKLPPSPRNSSNKLSKKNLRKKVNFHFPKHQNVTLLCGQKLVQKVYPKRTEKQARRKHKTALVLVWLTSNCCCGYGLLRTTASLSFAGLLLYAPGP